MERRVEGAFARILETYRRELNARFVHARHLNRRLDAGQFSDYLAQVVYPIVSRAENMTGAPLDDLVLELYDQSLHLLAHGYLGKEGRYPAMEKVWRELLPEMVHLMIDSPRPVITRICNAAVNLSAEKGIDVNRWVDCMRAISPICTDVKTFPRTGIVLAWRLGMAHFRNGALKACKKIPPSLLVKIFDLDKNIFPNRARYVFRRIHENPWFDPNRDIPGKKNVKKSELAILKKTGGFKGFGGYFINPPRVWLSDGNFFVSDTESTWILHADIFGATLHRTGDAAESEFLPGEPPDSATFSINKSGRVIRNKEVRDFPELANWSSWASTDNTLVVCLPFSHYVHVVALRGENADGHSDF